MSEPETTKHGSWDLAGFGKVAEAIPPEVYKQTTATVCKTFETLVAPITETTAGFGRLVRQTFDNWVEARKVIGTYTLQQAVARAKERVEKQGKTLLLPQHPKGFVRALEESSLETDLALHEMWVNLLASQMIDGDSHPRFVGILSQLGPAEAKLLSSLRPRPEDSRLTYFVGGSEAHFGMSLDWFSALDQPTQPWNLSVTLICQQSLAEISPLYHVPEDSVLLHLTPFGAAFMTVVNPPKV